jgi:hypothetical protein
MLLADNPAVLPAGSQASPVSTLVIESWNTTLQQPAQASGHPTRSMFLLAVGTDGSLTTPPHQHVLTATG